MAVINSQRNGKGIQSLGTEFQDLVAAGHGCMIAHTNGKTYCVFARNYSNAVAERRLYISVTTDNGVTWAAPTQLTSGKWDDDPGGAQLDPLSNTSDIGIIFTRATDPISTGTCTLTRIGIDQATLALTTPVDPITGSPTGFKSPSLVKTAAGYKIFVINAAYTSSASVQIYANSAFDTNTWTASALTNFWGGSTLNPFSLSVKKLLNGDLCAISSVRTALNGSTSTGVGNLPKGIVRLDVYVAFSQDDGATWGTVQNLTNYSGTPSLDLAGLTVALDSDFTQLSDGTIVVAYQEGLTPQFVDANTTLVLPANAGNVTSAVYHTGKNYLILGTDDATNGGVFIFDLTGQTVTHLNTASTPALWGNQVKSMALSFDDKYLAIGHVDGLEIFNTTDPTIANWTNTPIRTTTTPASIVSSMHSVRFDTAGYILYVSYGVGSASNTYGFLIDASSPSALTDLKTTIGGTVANVEFIVAPAAVYAVPLGRIARTNKTTGLDAYTVASGGAASWQVIAYDDVNSEIVVGGTQVGGTQGISRVSDTGATFSILQDFNTGTNPSGPNGSFNTAQFRRVSGNGILYQAGASNATTLGYYSFGIRKPLGYLNFSRTDLDIYEAAWNSTFQGAAVLKAASWFLNTNGAAAVMFSLTKSGRPRYGFFPYNTGTHQLTTAGVDFYDMTNTLHLASYDKLQKMRISSDTVDTIMAYFRKADLTLTTGQWSAVNAHVEPDTRRLTMRARILNHYTRSLQMRARIRTNPTHTINVRARIVIAQCIQIRARIVPVNTATLNMRARILGAKSSRVLNEYLVAHQAVTRIPVTFYAGSAQVGEQTLSMRARIAKVLQSRVTGYFLVYNTRNGAQNLDLSASQTTYQILTVRARISNP